MKKSSNSMRIGIAVAVILGTIGWLAFTSYGANKSYYVTVAELGKMGDKAFTRNLRVEGFVEPGSIEQDGPHVTFVLNEFESHSPNAPKGPEAHGAVQGLRAAAGHFQGRCTGLGDGHNRTRWRLSCNGAASQVRQQIRSGTAGKQTRRDTGAAVSCKHQHARECRAKRLRWNRHELIP